MSNYFFAKTRSAFRNDDPNAIVYIDTLSTLIDSTSKYAHLSNSRELLIGLNILMGSLHTSQKNFLEAKRYYGLAIVGAKESQSLNKLRVAYFNRHVVSKHSGELDSALFYYKKSMSARDSILSKKHQTELDELDLKYKTERIQKENITLSTTNEIQKLKISRQGIIISVISLLGVALGAIVFLLFRYKNEKEKYKRLEIEQKLLRAQLNPHFMFNALNSIQQYIYQKKDPALIADYLAKFSRLTRKILQHSREELIPLEDEIDFLKDYMDVQSIRFDTPFEYKIDVNEKLLNDEVMIPPMLSQPFVENSIEHGILSKRGAGRIEVKMYPSENYLLIQIEDNGIGINQAKFKKRSEHHRSLATSITKERLMLIEKKEKKNTSMTVEDLSDSNDLITGTLVNIKIPLLYES